MRRYTQTFEELSAKLSAIDTTWRDAYSERVERALHAIPEAPTYEPADVKRFLDIDFKAGMTVLRLFSGMSKDEFHYALRGVSEGRSIGVTEYRRDPDRFLGWLAAIGVLDRMQETVNRPVSWRDLLVERLRSMRGTAIKGQMRGRFLEDAVETVVQAVFDRGYTARCRFLGASGTSTEKADFAIPSKDEPRILIEVKAYGATGSKQTDVLGDFERIVRQKRDDTTLLLVTDGVTWLSRANDLRKLIRMQNAGQIARIYTQLMLEELREDLATLRQDHAL